MSDREPTDEEVVEALYAYAADQMSKGLHPLEVEAKIMEQGFDQETASAVVNNLNEARDSAARSGASSAGMRNMLVGALWCVGGIVVTAVSYGRRNRWGYLRRGLGCGYLRRHPVHSWADSSSQR